MTEDQKTKAVSIVIQLYSPARNYVMAAVLKLWDQIENPTPSIDAHLRKEHSYKMLSRSDMKPWSLILFLEEVAQEDDEEQQQQQQQQQQQYEQY